MPECLARCEDESCQRFWRENCPECAQDVADNHRKETGHQVHLIVNEGDRPLWRLRRQYPQIYGGW